MQQQLNNKIFKHSSLSLGYTELGDASITGKRIYVTPEGAHYPSITTILSAGDHTALDQWRAAIGETEASRVVHHACTRGTALHDIAERYLKNDPEYMPKTTMPHVRALFNSVKPIIDAGVDEVILQERPLYSDKLGVAGRVDLVAVYEGTPSIIDFKTSKRFKNKNEINNYFIQAAFYGAAFYERTGLPIKQSVIIMAVDDSPRPLVFKETIYDWLPQLIECIKNYNKINNGN
jgi:hypothetical protein